MKPTSKKILILGFAASLVTAIILTIVFIDINPNNGDPYDPPDEPDDDVVSKGDRLLGIAISGRADSDFEAAFQEVQNAKVDFITFSQQWDDIETAPGVYYNGETNHLMKIANDYYSAYGMKVAVTINPIDTIKTRVPSDLVGLPLNNSQVVMRFNNMTDWIMTQIPDLDLVSFSIGNEMDIFLGEDIQKWAEFADFFNQTLQYIKSKEADLIVGTKATFSGLTTGISKQQLLSINHVSDAILVTFYPFTSGFKFKDPALISTDIDILTALYPSDEIQFLEAGYASSTDLDSSENRQAQFVHEMFNVWDDNKNQISAICFVWLYDITQETLDVYEQYYGISDPNFLAYLATLGLIKENFAPKVAFSTLKAEINARGW